jgi:hypothetical protein
VAVCDAAVRGAGFRGAQAEMAAQRTAAVVEMREIRGEAVMGALVRGGWF